jgi:hypothetical protein
MRWAVSRSTSHLIKFPQDYALSQEPGQVAQAIEALLKAKPDATFTVTELCQNVFGIEAVTQVQNITIRRALRDVLLRNPDWSHLGAKSPRHHPGDIEHMIYNTRSWASVKKAGHGGYMGDGDDAARQRYFAVAGDFEPE